MAAPVVHIAYDKPSYAVGDLMTVTMTYSDDDSRVITGTGTVTDASGTPGTSTTTVILDPTTATVTDDGGRTYTKVSDSGTVAVFTAVA